MPKPLAICIEDMDAQAGNKYLRCVALPGRQPGLRLDEAGGVLWQSDDGVSCELWVSADDRLMLYRPEGAARVTLRRAGRSLDAPCGKPVVLIDQDQLDVGGRRLRIHVHGESPSVAAPSPLPSRSRPLGRLAQAAATAAIIGAVTTMVGCTENPPTIPPSEPTEVPPTIDVRENPPTIITVTPLGVPANENSIAGAIQGEWIVAHSDATMKDDTVLTIGTLTIEGSSYTFTQTHETTGTLELGRFDFLFDIPRGEIVIEYRDGIAPDDSLEGLASHDVLAVCVFHADFGAIDGFLIRVGDHDTLYFHSIVSEITSWRVTKQLGINTGQ